MNNKSILINMEILLVIKNHHKEVKFRCCQGPESIYYIPNIKKLFKFSMLLSFLNITGKNCDLIFDPQIWTFQCNGFFKSVDHWRNYYINFEISTLYKKAYNVFCPRPIFLDFCDIFQHKIWPIMMPKMLSLQLF